MPFSEITRLSPNAAATQVNERRGVCFHHSISSFDETIERMLDAASRVSYHVLIAPDGQRCTLVKDEHIAWHAGNSVFRGRKHCNEFLLGAAFAGNTYTNPLTEAQIASALEWLADRWETYTWTAASIVDHRQIAPSRKDDLNPVEWTRLFAAIQTRFG